MRCRNDPLGNGFYGRYEVSDRGEVRPDPPYGGSTVMKPYLLHGYTAIKLRRPGYRQGVKLHTLVAEAFVPGRSDEFNEVRHKDGNRQNCAAENLEWVSRSETRTFTTAALMSLGYLDRCNFILTGSDGAEIRSANLNVTCKQNGLRGAGFHLVLAGKRRR